MRVLGAESVMGKGSQGCFHCRKILERTGGAVKAAAVVAIAAALAATAIVTVSATEGARFDGSLTVPDDQPIVLIQPNGARKWVPLHELKLEHLQGVSHGAVAGFDQGVGRGRRNPPNRQGWTYQTEFGASSLRGAAGDDRNAFSGRAAIGFMPGPRYGLLFGGAFASGQRSADEGERQDAEQVVELQAFAQAEW